MPIELKKKLEQENIIFKMENLLKKQLEKFLS